MTFDPAQIEAIKDEFKVRIREDFAGLVANNDRITADHEYDLKTKYADEMRQKLALLVPAEDVFADLARHMAWDMGKQTFQSARDRGTKKARAFFLPRGGQEVLKFDPTEVGYFAGNDTIYSVYPDNAPRYDLPMRRVPIRMAQEDVHRYAKERADEAGLLIHFVQIVRSMDFPPNTVFGDPVAKEIHAEMLRRA